MKECTSHRSARLAMRRNPGRTGTPVCLLLAAGIGLAACSSGRGDGDRTSPGATAGKGGRDVIRVHLDVYNPGRIPAGIGEPVQEAARLAREWEALHPGKRIKFQPIVVAGESGSEGEWLKTQLLGEIAPEIIHQNAEIAWQDVDKGWYVPLDDFMEQPNPYIPGNQRWIESFSNQDLVSAKRAPDGKLYCVSIDIIETGFFYNKTLLKKLGIEAMPRTWANMIAMLREIDRQGFTPMTTARGGLGSDWGQDIIFEMLYHDILPQMDLIPSSPDAAGYLGHYLEPREAGFLYTKGFFTRRDPRWREMNRILHEWRQYWAKELRNSDQLRLFLTGRVPILWDMSILIRRLSIDPYLDFDWGVAYLPSITKETSRYGSGTPATVIGGAAVQLHVTNSAVKNKNLEDCIDFLMFISAPKSIERLASEALVFIPNVKGAKVSKELEPFREIFQRRYCAIKWLDSMDGQYKKYWRRMLDYYLNDGVDLDGFLAMLEANFAGWVESHIGKGGWDFEAMETVWRQREAVLLRELEPAS